ncbi:Beta-1,4-mannosyl-glycoprotein 4-beta-N-acetylglucosaminyltransferase [Collichthys lucidus]|uniref:Beta-1,4-mannosyl-glycoprotein 4-beta-N-acetylglucosaminyltransferase n=1 Tax=Collichthys lucidus TaxID=240159 RepID=A0A4V6ANE1_COLLU|nr:Beta-1,4-mannosyl-glycoprotein 4-beta-N-acetylglucosaminyltransferase [Collichthys lucidus]
MEQKRVGVAERGGWMPQKAEEVNHCSEDCFLREPCSLVELHGDVRRFRGFFCLSLKDPPNPAVAMTADRQVQQDENAADTGCSCCARWVCVSSPSSTTTRPFTTSPCCVSSPPRTPTSNPSSWSQASSGGKRRRLLRCLSSVSQTAKLESWQMLREGEEEEGQEEGMDLGIGGVMVGGAGIIGKVGLQIRLREEPAPPHPWEKPEENQRGDTPNEDKAEDLLLLRNPSRPAQPARSDLPEVPLVGKEHWVVSHKDKLDDSFEIMGDLHTRTHQLQDDKTSYFVRTKAGALCFRQGTEVATPKEYSGKTGGSVANGVVEGARPGVAGLRKPLEVQQQSSIAPKAKARARGNGKRLVKCVCRPGWHGPYCGVPTMVYHSNLPTKERLTPRDTPRRVINAININHEFDLLHVRFRELAQAVDLFLVCESNFTAYGEKRPLNFLRLLLNGTYDYIRHKILYVFLDHFPEGGRQDGWIADDYLRTFLTHNGMSRVSLYGFFWKQFGSLEVVSGCTVGMLRDVYDGDGIKLRRREYYTMPGFRKYENDTGHILVQWSVGSPFHFAGWHCSWCFTPEGIYFKLVSAQNGDFPRWGDYEDKRDLNYIRDLIRTGGWFDGSVQEYPPADPKEHMYAPKYMLEHSDRYRYLLENPYIKVPRHSEG